MNRKIKTLITILCTMFSAGTIALLYALSPLTEDVHRWSFHRDFINSPLKKIHDYNLGVNSYYISGVDEHHIYLGNLTAPFNVWSTNHQLQNNQHASLEIALDSAQSINQFRLSVDFPYFFLTHGTMPSYLRGKIGVWKARSLFENSLDYSVESLPISSNTIIFRSLSTATNSYELARKSGKNPITFNSDLLNKQIDGIFCLDGKLLYDKKTSKVIYLHYYRNEIVVADTTLKLLARMHTIDTFSRAQIKISKQMSNGESMLSAPPFKINTNAAAYNNKLFVRSNLLSSTEDMHDFLSNTVIDVYDIEHKSYIKSFYIPERMNEKISSFVIYDDKIISISGDYISVYMLPKEILITENGPTQTKLQKSIP